MSWWMWVGAILLVIALYDVFQTKHAILRNFPSPGTSGAGSTPLREVFGYQSGWEFPSPEDAAATLVAMGIGPGDMGEPAHYAEP